MMTETTLKTTRMFRMAFMIAVLAILGLLSCRDKPDYQVEFQERILLQLLLEPVPNPGILCSEFFRSQSECLTQTSGLEFSPSPLNLAILNLSALSENPPSGLELESVCSDILKTGFYSRFTTRAQGCYFGCKRDLWRVKVGRQECNVEGKLIYSAESEIQRTVECIRKCGQVNNTESFP